MRNSSGINCSHVLACVEVILNKFELQCVASLLSWEVVKFFFLLVVMEYFCIPFY